MTLHALWVIVTPTASFPHVHADDGVTCGVPLDPIAVIFIVSITCIPLNAPATCPEQWSLVPSARLLISNPVDGIVMDSCPSDSASPLPAMNSTLERETRHIEETQT